jgi:hypothetical protein
VPEVSLKGAGSQRTICLLLLTCPLCNGQEERYLIVACTVITDVPEAVGP